MATGRSTQLTRQIGEHLVAAKLGRLGLFATPFAGNVPEFDLLVADGTGKSALVQVKAINGPSWQFTATTYLDITVEGNVQIVNGKRKLANPDLVCVLILLREDEPDNFYVLSASDLQNILFGTYKGGVRPKNPSSMHCAVWPKELGAFRDNWKLVEENLR